MPDYGVNPVGLKETRKNEELRTTDNLKPTYPDRTATFVRNSPLMTQFDHIDMFDLEEYNQREMIEKQKTDVLRIYCDCN